MKRPRDYLKIPLDYDGWLGGLGWTSNMEAIADAAADPAIGLTFAMSAEIALFLEGFHASGVRPIHFGHILHLLHLLGLGTRDPGATLAVGAEHLARAFREEGRPLRNAGAFCSWLCRSVPRVAYPPDVTEVCRTLRQPPSDPLVLFFDGKRLAVGEDPPLSSAEFQERVLEALDEISPAELRHWLRRGRPPIGEASEHVAGVVPRTLAGTLAVLGRRPRLAAAASLVAQLEGALALPPRRLALGELPTGGYVDVATRGLPEQILPAQLALDGEEFVRRFAEHELLYFHREEPHAPITEELVVLLDQGVRTWGDVRLVLAGATLALGRRASRRGIPLLIAATSTDGRIDDPSRLDDEAIAAVLESSDLSPDPGRALGRVLESPAEAPRDVVLLTHPRNLAEPEVAASARRVAPGTRLFCVAVDGGGEVSLSEVRHGAPVALGRFRVDFRSPAGPSESPWSDTAGSDAWTGDVEPIGFPFRLGALSRIDDQLHDFDGTGERLLLAGQHGLLHCWRVDGSASEMLPRAVVLREVVALVEAVVGVAGGFVVIGRTSKVRAVVHYDIAGRVCKAHRVPLGATRPRWVYEPAQHTIVGHIQYAGTRWTPVFAVDLGADRLESCYPPESPNVPASERAKRAFFRAFSEAEQYASPMLAFTTDGSLPGEGRSVRLNSTTGTIDVRGERWPRCSFTPLSDGKPKLKGGRIIQARWNGDTLALLVVFLDLRRAIHLFAISDGRALGEFPMGRDVGDFALSPDGRRFARRIGERHLEVRGVGGGSLPLLVTSMSKAHSRIEVELGATFLTIQAGSHVHLARWDRPRLELNQGEGDAGKLVAKVFGGELWRMVRATAMEGGVLWRQGAPHHDRRRFQAFCQAFGLTVVVDFLGQVAILDRNGVLVCMFFVFRDKIAAWMPDGTRVGPVPMIGGQPTPDGLERIAAALRMAGERKGVPVR